MYQQSVDLFHRHCKILDCFCVEKFTELNILLGLINICICRTVHYCLNIFFGNHAAHSLEVGNIELGNVGKNIVVGTAARHYAHFIAQLSVCTGNKNIHFT